MAMENKARGWVGIRVCGWREEGRDRTRRWLGEWEIGNGGCFNLSFPRSRLQD